VTSRCGMRRYSAPSTSSLSSAHDLPASLSHINRARSTERIVMALDLPKRRAFSLDRDAVSLLPNAKWNVRLAARVHAATGK